MTLAGVTKFWYSRQMASKNTSIALGAPYTTFARRKVESGEFGSTSEVVREAMRRYIAEEAEVETLRRLISEGEESGPPEPFVFAEFIAEMKAQSRDAA